MFFLDMRVFSIIKGKLFVDCGQKSLPYMKSRSGISFLSHCPEPRPSSFEVRRQRVTKSPNVSQYFVFVFVAEPKETPDARGFFIRARGLRWLSANQDEARKWRNPVSRLSARHSRLCARPDAASHAKVHDCMRLESRTQSSSKTFKNVRNAYEGVVHKLKNFVADIRLMIYLY
jgi:hypothetical protein